MAPCAHSARTSFGSATPSGGPTRSTILQLRRFRVICRCGASCCPATPNLALFLIGGSLIGAGVGAVFKGATGIVLESTAPEYRLAMTSALLIALFIGLSVPVIGVGIALDQGATAPDTLLVFAIVVGLGVSVAGWTLLGRRRQT